MLVMVEQHFANAVLDRHNGVLEAPFGPALRGTALTFDGEAIDIFAGEAIECRDHVGTNALRCVIIVESDIGVRCPGPTVIAHDSATHALHAAANASLHHARMDLHCNKVDRIKGGRTEAVDLLPAN